MHKVRSHKGFEPHVVSKDNKTPQIYIYARSLLSEILLERSPQELSSRGLATRAVVQRGSGFSAVLERSCHELNVIYRLEN